VKRKVGCGLWLVWLLGVLFVAEWLLLWLVFQTISREHLLLAVLAVILLTILGGSVAVCFRVQRRAR
jgi:hypothetical protein